MRFYLFRIPLNAQGYTSSGVYFGAGQSLYYYQSDNECGNLRAPSRAAAKTRVLALYPGATFYR